MRIVIAGATGFLGRRLVAELLGDGHEVVALARKPPATPLAVGVETLAIDIGDEHRLAGVLEGADAAYYLVHSMASTDEFARRDLDLAGSFARAAHKSEVGRIIYVGALGQGSLSKHLSSRQEVGDALRALGTPVIELRAAVILGSGSISYEMLRHLVERLPAMVCPRWVRTKIAPIAVADMLRYLAGSLSVEPGVYEVGVSKPTSYRQMMDIYARARGIRRRLIIDVPLLSLKLSSYWVDFVTPVDKHVSHSLIASLAHEVVVTQAMRTEQVFGFQAMGIEEAMEQALKDQAASISKDLLELRPGYHDGVHVVRVERSFPLEQIGSVRDDLASVGGDLRWYGLAWAWWLRLLIGRAIGESVMIGRPGGLSVGAAVDWWLIDRADQDAVVLRARYWRTGEAWLGYAINPVGSITQIAAFRPKGIPGLLYWSVLSPIHRLVFAAMARHRVARSR